MMRFLLAVAFIALASGSLAQNKGDINNRFDERLPVDRTPQESPIKTAPCTADCRASLTMTFADAHVERMPAKTKQLCGVLMCEIWRMHAHDPKAPCDPVSNSTAKPLWSDAVRPLRAASVLRTAQCQ